MGLDKDDFIITKQFAGLWQHHVFYLFPSLGYDYHYLLQQVIFLKHQYLLKIKRTKTKSQSFELGHWALSLVLQNTCISSWLAPLGPAVRCSTLSHTRSSLCLCLSTSPPPLLRFPSQRHLLPGTNGSLSFPAGCLSEADACHAFYRKS